MTRLTIAILFFLLMPDIASAEEIYMTTENYISAAIGKKPEKPGILWITRDIKPIITRILRGRKSPLRYRYYRKDSRIVWILDIIGKTLPITTGITIESGKIIDLTVLTYRESHGSEIRYPVYSRQFNDIGLTEKLLLSKPVDGISGATLSSNAMKRIARLALYLSSKALEKDAPQKQKQTRK